jgi:hypothetical protein
MAFIDHLAIPEDLNGKRAASAALFGWRRRESTPRPK